MDLHGFRKELNLRDLGGYKTADGREVRKGLLYRSSALYFFNEEELKNLEALHLKTILDFRTEKGARKRPDPPLPGARYIRSCSAFEDIFEDLNSPKELASLLFDEDQKGNAAARLISSYSASLAFSNEAYQLMFSLLLAGEVPILFHCSNGKDRTGVAAMLILLALGVPEETVMEDYLLSNEYRKPYLDQLRAEHPRAGRSKRSAGTILTMIAGVIPESADMMMSEILERYGTYENFFEIEYGLNAENREKLRRMYLK